MTLSRDHHQEQAERRKSLIDQMQGKDLFLLWWLFFDVKHTRHLRVLISHPVYRIFNHELIGFLSNTQVQSVRKCTFRYNWILKSDYTIVLSSNMPNLQHVIFYHDPPTDELLRLIAENCQRLLKVEFISKSDTYKTPTITEIMEMHTKSKENKGIFSSSGKLTSKGYQMLFDKQKSLREIDLTQVEDSIYIDTPIPYKYHQYTPIHTNTTRPIQIYRLTNGIANTPNADDDGKKLGLIAVQSMLKPLKHMPALIKLIVTHNYVQIMDSLPQVQQLELRLNTGATHYLETVDFLVDKPVKFQPLDMSIYKAVDSNSYLQHTASPIPMNKLLFSDMNKVDTANLQIKFPNIKKLILELKVYAAAKDGALDTALAQDNGDQVEDNPDLWSLGVLHTEYSSSFVKEILEKMPVSLHVKFHLSPHVVYNGHRVTPGGVHYNYTTQPLIPLFHSVDALLMKSFEAFHRAETIRMVGGMTETLFQFRANSSNLKSRDVYENHDDPDLRLRVNQEEDWGGWNLGLNGYMKDHGTSINGHMFTKIGFPNLTVLELYYGDTSAGKVHCSIGNRHPPISHDMFCQVFFFSESLRKIKLTIPGGIAKFDEKEFISRCFSIYGRKKLSRLNHVSLWFSNQSINPAAQEAVETMIISVTGFLQLLSVCSKETSVENMVWLNVTGDEEKRYLRENETEGTYLPCVTHLLNYYLPMVATYKTTEGSKGTHWICSNLKRVAMFTTEERRRGH